MKKRRINRLSAIVFIVLSVDFVGRCDAFQYEAKGKRDPFVPLVGMDRPAVASLEDVSSVDDLKLEGIAIGAQGRKIAILNGEALKEGDKIGEVELKTVAKKSVNVMVGGKPYELVLSGEEGGAKGGKR
jgi:hypothetical protein